MASRGRRRGVFEGLPRALYRRAGADYVDACARSILVNGVVVAGVGVAVVALYVELRAGELALLAGCSAAGYLVENLVAGAYLRRIGEPVRAWLRDASDDEAARRASSAAAQLPLALVRRPSLYAIGLLGAVITSVVLTGILDLPARHAALAVPVLGLMYVSSAVLRYTALELSMRPVLEAVGERLSYPPPPKEARVSLHQRLLVTVPMVTWGGAVVVAGIVTENTRELDTLGSAGVIAFGVSAAISSAPTRPGSSPRPSTRWSAASPSASSCARRSAPSSTRRSPSGSWPRERTSAGRSSTSRSCSSTCAASPRSPRRP